MLELSPKTFRGGYIVATIEDSDNLLAIKHLTGGDPELFVGISVAGLTELFDFDIKKIIYVGGNEGISFPPETTSLREAQSSLNEALYKLSIVDALGIVGRVTEKVFLDPSVSPKFLKDCVDKREQHLKRIYDSPTTYVKPDDCPDIWRAFEAIEAQWAKAWDSLFDQVHEPPNKVDYEYTGLRGLIFGKFDQQEWVEDLNRDEEHIYRLAKRLLAKRRSIVNRCPGGCGRKVKYNPWFCHPDLYVWEELNKNNRGPVYMKFQGLYCECDGGGKWDRGCGQFSLEPDPSGYKYTCIWPPYQEVALLKHLKKLRHVGSLKRLWSDPAKTPKWFDRDHRLR